MARTACPWQTAIHLAVVLGHFWRAKRVISRERRRAPAEGGIFKRCWWRYWRPADRELPPVPVRLPNGEQRSIPAVPLPERFDQVVQSWDLAFKGLDTSDYVVGQTWGAKGADRFLLDQQRERLDMPGTVQAIRAMTAQWPQAAAKLVEDRANGPAVIAALQHEIAGLIAVNPDGGKVARAAAVSPQVEAGNVCLPHPSLAGWVDGLIEECAGFPYATHDDQVDALTQALNRLYRGSGAIYPVPESDLMVDPFEIPAYWPRGFAMDTRWNGVAVLWGARDPQSDVLYLYSEYCQSNTEPTVQAREILDRGAWIPGVIDLAGGGRSSEDRWRLLQIYQRLGVDLQPAESSEESGICEVWQRMNSARLRVFRTLTGFLQEYRLYRRNEQGQVVRQNDQLMGCLRCLCVSCLHRMRVPRTGIEPLYVNSEGPYSWMA